MTMTPQEELAALIDAAKDQENTLAAQATELDGLLRELSHELSLIRKYRLQYEADLREMRSIIQAIQRGALITVEPPPTSTCGGPDEFRTLSAPTYYTPPHGYGIQP